MNYGSILTFTHFEYYFLLFPYLSQISFFAAWVCAFLILKVSQLNAFYPFWNDLNWYLVTLVMLDDIVIQHDQFVVFDGCEAFGVQINCLIEVRKAKMFWDYTDNTCGHGYKACTFIACVIRSCPLNPPLKQHTHELISMSARRCHLLIGRWVAIPF